MGGKAVNVRHNWDIHAVVFTVLEWWVLCIAGGSITGRRERYLEG